VDEAAVRRGRPTVTPSVRYSARHFGRFDEHVPAEATLASREAHFLGTTRACLELGCRGGGRREVGWNSLLPPDNGLTRQRHPVRTSGFLGRRRDAAVGDVARERDERVTRSPHSFSRLLVRIVGWLGRAPPRPSAGLGALAREPSLGLSRTHRVDPPVRMVAAVADPALVVRRGPDMVRRERYRGVRHVRGWFGLALRRATPASSRDAMCRSRSNGGQEPTKDPHSRSPPSLRQSSARYAPDPRGS